MSRFVTSQALDMNKFLSQLILPPVYTSTINRDVCWLHFAITNIRGNNVWFKSTSHVRSHLFIIQGAA